MKTITLTAEEIKWLEYQFQANPCRGGCVVHDETGHYPRADCYECKFTKAIDSVEEKIWGK